MLRVITLLLLKSPFPCETLDFLSFMTRPQEIETPLWTDRNNNFSPVWSLYSCATFLRACWVWTGLNSLVFHSKTASENKLMKAGCCSDCRNRKCLWHKKYLPSLNGAVFGEKETCCIVLIVNCEHVFWILNLQFNSCKKTELLSSAALFSYYGFQFAIQQHTDKNWTLSSGTISC